MSLGFFTHVRGSYDKFPDFISMRPDKEKWRNDVIVWRAKTQK